MENVFVFRLFSENYSQKTTKKSLNSDFDLNEIFKFCSQQQVQMMRLLTGNFELPEDLQVGATEKAD